MRKFLLILAFDGKRANRTADLASLADYLPGNAAQIMAWETGIAIAYEAESPIPGHAVGTITRGTEQHISVEMADGGEWALAVNNRDGVSWFNRHVGKPSARVPGKAR